MVERALLFAVALCACGRIGFDEPTRDAPGDGPIDAGFGPWTVPVPIAELNSAGAQDDDPSLTADMLEIFFDSDRAPGTLGDVFTARRASPTAPFGPVTIVSELASISDDTGPDVSPDGLTLYMSSDRRTAGDRDLYISTRTDRNGPWSVPARVVELASPHDDANAYETADGLAIYFATTRPDGTDTDIYVATRLARNQVWGVPARVPGVSEPGMPESQHWIHSDATVIYFAAGFPGDVWSATRSDPSQPFGARELVPVINDAAVEDSDPWLSPDQRTLVFMSYRSGMGDIYIATRW